MCLYPKLIYNRKYTKTKKNGGIIPPVYDRRVLAVPVGCQRCLECRKQKATQWQVRLTEEIRRNKAGKFVTLTFGEKELIGLENECNEFTGYEKDNAVAALAIRRFLERWRKKYKTSVRHWLVTELGQTNTERLHIHGIIWTEKTMEEIEERWQYGFMWKSTKEKNYVNGATVGYVVKYIMKADEKHRNYIPRIFTSSGIGRGYEKSRDAREINKFNEAETDEGYRTQKGHKIAMPIYYRNKIYNDDQREKLWLHRMDRNERWICGEKVKADDDEAYYKLLKYHRKRNKQLGYGGDVKTWNKLQYENERRGLLGEERRKAAALRPIEDSATLRQDSVLRTANTYASGGVFLGYYLKNKETMREAPTDGEIMMHKIKLAEQIIRFKFGEN